MIQKLNEEIEVYLFKILNDSDKFLDKEMLLPQTRYDKYISLTDKNSKIRNIVAYLLIDKYLKVNSIINTPIFTYGYYDKPKFDNINLEFNISHSKDFVVVAFSKDEVGVDIEPIGDFSSELKNYMLCDDELKKYKSYDSKFFTKIWSMKEAYIKKMAGNFPTDLGKLQFEYKSGVEYKESFITVKTIGGNILSVCGTCSNINIKEIKEL